MKEKRIVLSGLLTMAAAAAFAGVPVRWTVETSRVQPVTFDAVRGETLSLEATFKSYGRPVDVTNHTAMLYWQTNGMGSAWWSTNAVTLSGSTAAAAFTGGMDPGADAVLGFIALRRGAESAPYQTSYRAAFTIRFRHGPGAVPNAIPLPARTLDFATTAVANADAAPFALKGGGGGGGITAGEAGEIATNVVERAGKQDALTAAQTNAVNSGITAEKVEKYESIITTNSYGDVGIAFAMDTFTSWSSDSTANWNDGSTANWNDGSTANWMNGSSARWEEGCFANWSGGSSATWEAGCFSQWLDGSHPWLESATDFHIGGTIYDDATPLPTWVDGRAEACFSANADYALTNLAANARYVTLASGTIANLTTTGGPLYVSLTFGADIWRSCDALMRIVNASGTALRLSNANAVLDGAMPDVKAGTNLVMFTKTAYDAGASKSIVTISVKEVK